MATYPKLAQAYAVQAGATLYTGPGGGAIIRQIRAVTVGTNPGDATAQYFRMAHGADYEDHCIVPWTLVGIDDIYEDDCFIGVASGDTVKLMSDDSDTALVVSVFGVVL